MNKIIIAIMIIAIAVGCSFGNDAEFDTVSSDFVLTTVRMNSLSGSVSASAEVPSWRDDVDLELVDGFTGQVDNYPEIGQTTRFSVETANENFLITSITDYPESEPFLFQTIEAYLLNSAGNHINFLDREIFETTFKTPYEDYVRTENIVSFDEYDENRDAHIFYSKVEYRQRLQGREFSNMTINGVREYFEFTDKQRVEISETGTVVNMEYNGVIYRGRSNFEAEISYDIIDGIKQNIVSIYTFDNGIIIQ